MQSGWIDENHITIEWNPMKIKTPPNQSYESEKTVAWHHQLAEDIINYVLYRKKIYWEIIIDENLKHNISENILTLQLRK